MIRFKTVFSKLSAFILLITLLPSQAFAGTTTSVIPDPSINFSLIGGATAIPTLSGTMLVILSLLLFVVAFRVAKQKNSNTGKLFMTLLGVSAIALGSGGFKMIADVNAAVEFPAEEITITGELSQTLDNQKEYTFINNNTQSLAIALTNGEINERGAIPDSDAIECSNGGTLNAFESCGILCENPGSISEIPE